jgi:hypothetical protein
MDMSKIYRLGHEYIDDIANSKEKDQFVKWMPGIGNSKGIRYARFMNFNFPLPAFIVLITREINHKHHNPWDDIIDYNSSKIFYWGDAKHNISKGYKEYEGNKILMLVYETGLDGNNKTIPPILHFSKKKSGIISFSGICVITNVETTWFEDTGKPVKNYRFELTILDVEEINVDWIINRANVTSIKNLNNNLAPKAWQSYINGRIEKLKIFKKEILDRESQLPAEGSAEENILSTISKLKPIEFEAVLVELLKSLPHVNHNIKRTRLVKDGGFDFFGEFNLPFPFNYKIEFLGEAKKYRRSNSIGPGMVSRLVARLARGQYGIFVTTSYYTRQAQEEVLEDGYPVRLYSGLDIINFLRELKLIDFDRIKESWLKEVIKSFQHD